ncbi:cysteine dioxygenase [Streptomyces sp. Ru87]|uniref:Cysteine dioxygenase n=1 Tax=Streptomyces lycii TaxID=2654337 RepID=A0ABQ7FAX6_9ACTN|nr:cysteine dioxygenase [Streptomyces lycii]PGH50708.1 cysteine dioxygenase [Streptomyces sp. Ru87]
MVTALPPHAPLTPAEGRAPTPGALASHARFVAARPGLWRQLERFTRPERHWARLERTGTYEVWLLTWLPGQGTEIHGHGGSSGAFCVVRGELTERAFPPRGGTGAARPWRLGTGAVRGFGPRHVHRVTNEGGTPATSIHVYAPSLATMSYYEQTADGRLVEVRTEQEAGA